MATISGPGAFWLSGEPEKRMHGRLTFDAAGGRVELFGELGRIDAFEASSLGKYRRLIGDFQGEICTLDGCRPRSVNEFGGELRVQTIIVGAGFDAEEELAFDSVEVRPAFLERWAPADWLDEEPRMREQETRRQPQLTVKQVKPETAQIMDSLKLTIGSRFHVSGDGYSARALHNDRYCCVKSARLLPVGKLIFLANDFQDLISIATGRIAAFDKVVVSHRDFAIETPDGRMHLQRIGVYRQWRAVAESDGKPPEHHDLYFTYQDFGGIEGVARWMNTVSVYRSILGRLMATRYNQHSYLEDQALNRFVALEGLHRARTSTEDKIYKDRLLELANFAGDPFTELVGHGRVDQWAKHVKEERVELAHHLGRPADHDMTLVYYLSQSAYWLAALCLMREAGAPQETFDRWANHRRIGELRKNLGTVLP